MDTKPISQNNKLRNVFLMLLIILNLFYFSLVARAMGSSDDLMMYRDIGVIGEAKTTEGKKVSYNKATGLTNYVITKGNLVTPVVDGEVATFDLNGDYSFKFKGLGWKYSLRAHWASSNVKEDRVGFSVGLESPDKMTFIGLKEIDVFVNSSLALPLTEDQREIINQKGYVEDPFSGKDRIFVAQQATKWILDRNLDGYILASGSPISFTKEYIGDKEFVRAEVEISFKSMNLKRKSIIWALNSRGYRLKGEENKRKMETLICQVIDDSADYSRMEVLGKEILETLKFNKGRNVYGDLK